MNEFRAEIRIGESLVRLRPAPPSMTVSTGELPFGVNLSGFLASESGIGEAARGNARILNAAGIPCTLNYLIPPDAPNTNEKQAPTSEGNPYRFNLIHTCPKDIPGFIAQRNPAYLLNRYNIGYWAWEVPQFPAKWIPYFQHFDEIWAPSRFSRDAISSVAPVPVIKVPHIIVPPNHGKFPQCDREHFEIPSEPYLFLFIFDFRSLVRRKNPEAIIQAFRSAFGSSNRAHLVIKCSYANLHPEEFNRLKAAASGLSVQVIDGIFSREEIEQLIDLADCYVSLHRAEGFGLTMAEAMARGKPVIATNYSGNTDFMNAENSFLVDYQMVALEETYWEYERGSVWAEPDVQHAAELMQFVFQNREQARQVGKIAQQSVIQEFSPATISRVISDRLRLIYDDSEAGSHQRNVEIPVSIPEFAKRNPHRSTQAPRCSVIIPVFNKSMLTKQCLDTLLDHNSESTKFEIIVVDDCSTDGTPQLLAAYGDRIRTLRHNTNQGFGHACNDGAAIAQGVELVFLNNDTIAKPGWLDAMVRCADANPQAAAFGSKLLYSNETIQHAGMVFCHDRKPRHIYRGFPANHPAVNKTRRFQIVTGACLFVRRAPFEEVRGFDTEFVNSYEDIDICLRLGKLGYEIFYCHESELYHLESLTREGRVAEDARNFRIYMSRWAGQIVPDDLSFYVEDGLLKIDYGFFYPFKIAIATELASTHPEESGQVDRSRELHNLLKENTRLKLRLQEIESN